MTFVLVTFAATLSIVLGAYWAFVVRPESVDKDQLTGRLKNFKVKTVNITIANEGEGGGADVLGLQNILNRRRGLIAPLEQLLIESGLKLTAAAFILWTLGGIAVGTAVGWWFGRLAVSILLAVILGVLPLLYVRRVRTQRLLKFEEQFPEAVELIARSLRAGHAFTTGLGMVADEVPAPAGPEFRRVYDEQNFGMSLTEALRAMASRVPVLDARFFVTAVLTQRESGGNLSEVLDNLASVMRERFKVKRQIRVISAHGRLSAWILSCLAPGLAGVLFLMSPGFMRILWEDPLGLQLVIAAVVLQLTGTFIISRMVKIEY
jgi:tight adherence protein B